MKNMYDCYLRTAKHDNIEANLLLNNIIRSFEKIRYNNKNTVLLGVELDIVRKTTFI